MSDYRIIIFDSIHEVLRADKFFQNDGLKVKIIPPPRQLSADCGIALKVEEDFDVIADTLRKNALNPAGVFLKVGDRYVSEIKKLSFQGGING